MIAWRSMARGGSSVASGVAARRVTTRADAPAVELSRVSLRFGRTEVVKELSFRIAPGTICGLLAPSGGGKTTALRLITGVYPPDRFNLEERRRLGYMPQGFVLYPELSVRRNLEFMAGIYALPRTRRGARIDALLTMVDLTAAGKRRAWRLSGGMQRRLQLAATLLHDPQVLVIDEPTAGIDPLLRARFWEHFRQLRDEGRTLIVSTQYVTEAEYCDQVVMLRAGGVVAAGTPAELRQQAFGANRVAAGGAPPSFEDVFLRLMAVTGEG